MATDVKMEPIEDELKRLWDEEKGKNRIRASFFNLVIYSEKKGRDPHYRSLIDSVISKFPCRVILISVDHEQKESLKTEISSAAITDEIYCEIIHIEVGSNMIERVPFLILPQILPDLPLYLLWTVDPSTEKVILPALEPYAKRLILDSNAIQNLEQFSQNILTLINKFHCDVGDLNWAALRSWRTIFRGAFDAYEPFLDLINTKTLRIHYNKQNSTPFERSDLRAYYFQSWLAAQLGWRFKRLENMEGNLRITYERPTHEIAVILTPVDNPLEKTTLPVGALLSIHVESYRNKAEYIFKRHPESRQVFVQHHNDAKCDLPYCTFLTGMSEGQEIVQEIFYTTGGLHYKNMLTLLSHMQ